MTYRRDREITRELPAYRRILAFLTPSRGAATIWFTQTIDLTVTERWLGAEQQRTGKKLGLLHLFLAAAGRALHAHPNLNRYVTGHRVFQRDGVTISVSAKKALEQGAKVVLLKLPIEPSDGPHEVYDRFIAMLSEGRSGRELAQEREAAGFLWLPAFILAPLIAFARWLDARHWLPGPMVDPDPTFTSLVAVNLGSVGLAAGYHHLYEWGNCPFFAVIGRIEQRPLVVDGKIEARRVVDIKYTFDERVEDGLACAIALSGLQQMLEDPQTFVTGVRDHGGRPPKRA